MDSTGQGDAVKRPLKEDSEDNSVKRIKLDTTNDKIDDTKPLISDNSSKVGLDDIELTENDAKLEIKKENPLDLENRIRKPAPVAIMGISQIISEIRKTKLIKPEHSSITKTNDTSKLQGEKVEPTFETSKQVAQQSFKYEKRIRNKPKIKHQVEKDVGITEYIGEAQGFDGILKHRYSDFIVHEIDLEGQTIHLTNTKVLPIEEEIIDDEESINELLNDLLTREKLQHLNDLKSNTRKEKLVIYATDFSKEQRTKFHQCIKKNFPSLISMTAINGDDRIMEVWQRTERNDKNQKRKNWPSGRPSYTHFVLYKENTDTLEAINTIAYMMGMKSGALTYAGTKDKRAVTSQAVSVNRVEGARLLALNHKLKNMSIGNISYKSTPLQLGDLTGNKFVIVLRQVSGTLNQIDINMKLLAENGFINYFGLQRFGTSSVSTHSVGRALILCKWNEAIDLILKPRDEEGDENLVECRETWLTTKDPNLALSKLRWKGGIEGLLLKSLSKYDAQDFINALSGLPRNMRLLYLHSFQSYIWNKIVSKRISEMGLKVVEGDLWMPLKCQIKNDQSSVDNSKQKKAPKEKPLVATLEDIRDNKVTIYDVVMPLPGHDVIYPQNQVKEWFVELLAEDEMNLDSFDCKTKSYALGGSYRHILVKPKDVTWDILNYSERDQDLLVTDKFRLEGKDLPTNKEKGEFKALRFDISLPSSCYATMAIRQITRKDTSAWAQMQEVSCE